MTSLPRKRVLLFGATGTAGLGVAGALLEAGHAVVAVVRPGAPIDRLPKALDIHFGHPSDPRALEREVFADDTFDAVISCIASRTGLPEDAWAVDYAANAAILMVAKAQNIPQIILLSAICVQRSRLAFQEAKLAFESDLIASGLTYTIVRPTAFFKSLAGQVKRVQDGKPYLMFGNGRLTAAKPISDRDLGRFIATCLSDPDKQNRVLPIGGPGPALTPKDVGDMIFRVTRKPPRFRRMPPWVMRAIVGGLSTAAKVRPSLAAKAELARIGQYYGSESMLHFDEATHRYDAEMTPEFGEDRLEDFLHDVAEGHITLDLGDHAVF